MYHSFHFFRSFNIHEKGEHADHLTAKTMSPQKELAVTKSERKTEDNFWQMTLWQMTTVGAINFMQMISENFTLHYSWGP